MSDYYSKSFFLTITFCLISIFACSQNTKPLVHLIDGIPEYYFENKYLERKVDEVRDAMSCRNGICFGFLTDIHISECLPSEDSNSTAGNSGYSPYLLKYVMDRLDIPFVLFGGDVPVVRTASWDDILGSGARWQEMMEIIGSEKVFQTRGNHDYLGFAGLNSTTVSHSSPSFVYPIIMGGKHVYDVRSPEGKMYYYFDVDNTNLRVVVLDDYGDRDTPTAISGVSCIGQTQYDWLLNEALGCNNRDIILLSHQTADPVLNKEMPDVDANRLVLHEILSAFVNKRILDYTSTDNYGTVAVKKDFTNNTNTFICHLSGHNHVDQTLNTDGVLSIGHTSDCYSGYRPEGNHMGRTPGIITEHAISLFCVDFDSNTIKMIRIGAGENKVWHY